MVIKSDSFHWLLPRIQNEMNPTGQLAATQNHLIAMRKVFAASQAPGGPRQIREFSTFDIGRFMGYDGIL
jgi:hypothetical protein